jgi:hypothetical protein
MLNRNDRPAEILHAGAPYLKRAAFRDSRLPVGHPEGFIEAFANLYRDFSHFVRGDGETLVPGIDDGVRGMAFIERAVASSRSGGGWVALDV